MGYRRNIIIANLSQVESLHGQFSACLIFFANHTDAISSSIIHKDSVQVFLTKIVWFFVYEWIQNGTRFFYFGSFIPPLTAASLKQLVFTALQHAPLLFFQNNKKSEFKTFRLHGNRANVSQFAGWVFAHA